MVESARPSSSKYRRRGEDGDKHPSRGAQQPRRGHVGVDCPEQRGPREKARRQQADEQEDQRDQQARQENEEAGYIFLHAEDAQRAHAHQDEPEPCGPEGEAADQFRRGRQRSLIEQLGGPGAFRQLVELDQAQEAAQESI